MEAVDADVQMFDKLVRAGVSIIREGQRMRRVLLKSRLQRRFQCGSVQSYFQLIGSNPNPMLDSSEYLILF